MTLYQSGTLKINGVTIAPYSTPFNVDVIASGALEDSTLYVDKNNLSMVTPTNITLVEEGLSFYNSSFVSNASYALGTQDFTIETRLKPTNINHTFVSTFTGQTGDLYSGLEFQGHEMQLTLAIHNIGSVTRWFFPYVANTFYDLALVRKSGLLYFFVNKQKQSLVVSANYPIPAKQINVGKFSPTDQSDGKSIVEYFAVTIGRGKYTENYQGFQNYRVVAWR